MRPGTAWLAVKVAAFTLVVPGTVVVLVPYLLLEDPSPAAVDVFGLSFLGVLPIVLGLALYLRCALDFARSGGGTPAPIDPPVRLIASGPYRYTRNPMYVGILAVLAGEALLFRDLGLLYYLAAMALVFHGVVVGYEERVLERRFAPAYRRFRESVPRWLPGATGLKDLHERSFLGVGALLLAAGVVAHLLRLTVGLPVAEMPDSIHAFLVALSAYAVLGCLAYARRLDLRGPLHKIVFALIVLLLAVTLAMHVYSLVAGDSAWLGAFPMWYSVVAAAAYGGFAHFLATRTLREKQQRRVEVHPVRRERRPAPGR